MIQQLTPAVAARLLLTAKQNVAARRLAKRDDTPLHRAADAHLAPMVLALRAAFNVARKALGKNANVDAAVKALRSALLKVLPPVLLKVYVAGANAGVGMLPKRRAAEGLSSGRMQRMLAEDDSPFDIRFDVSSPEAIKWAREHTSKIADDISQTSKDVINEAIALALEGDGLDAAYDDILAAVGDEDRADMIARTECLPGETLVDAAVIGAVHRRWYEGNVIEVITRNGRQFTATPNHPMLTKRGWLAAGVLREGDYLVCDDREERLSSPSDKNMTSTPTPIAQLFDAAAQVGVVERRRGSDYDFHGDGMDGDVDVACPFRPLVVGDFAPLYEPLVHQFLAESDKARAPLCEFCGRLLSIHEPICFCHRAERDAVLLQNTLDYVRVDAKCEPQSFHRFARQVAARDNVGGDAGILVVDRTAALEEVSTSICERSYDASLAHNVKRPVVGTSDLLGNKCTAQSGKIELDDIASVTVRPFSGHVYNLSTPFGYFTIKGVGSKGKIFTGNTMTAANEGQREGWDQAIEAGLLTGDEKREWIATSDACPDCEELDGDVADLDGEYPNDGGDGPPLHPNCRCTEGISAGG